MGVRWNQRAWRTEDGQTLFWCPACVTVHGVDDSWGISGGDEWPTFEKSVLVLPSDNGYIKRCHSYLRGGKIEYLPDSDHELAGKSMYLPYGPDYY